MSKKYKILPGHRNPAGVSVEKGGVNFSVFSREATNVELALFEASDSPEPFQIIPLNIKVNRTFFAWHVFVEKLPFGTWYGWYMDGPNNVHETGLRFDREKLLVDPWGRAVSDVLWDRGAACREGDNTASAMRAMVVDQKYDWEGDKPLRSSHQNCIIYELHVGGFTRHPSANVGQPGTFSGIIEKIPYLKELGISHVELLPIMAFDEQDVPENTAQAGLKNYWGYSTHSFYSPHPGYCVTPESGSHQNEFRDLVKALHKAGIGIILDVVFNHTSEGGIGGPLINFKGMGNDIFYHLDAEDKNKYRDYTGCGNTVNANHPLVANFIISCLEFWVREMHVDGFRFDLASAMTRGETGEPLANPPVLWGIELSDQLADTKLIAEAWDAAGLYQVGCFPGYRWSEWNGLYRDVVRSFIRGDHGVISDLATRICGSSDLYGHQQRLPMNSINFVTCHDGFTLSDLVSYNEKHNEANGEGNNDGCNNNLSYNYGVEGDTDQKDLLKLRKRQAKNVIAILLLSQGIPMILSGDEVLKSQKGNNNGYCQDNELTWFDWGLLIENKDMLRFVQMMIQLRKSHPSLMRRHFLDGKSENGDDFSDVTWHGMDLEQPLWHESDNRVLAFTLTAVEKGETDLHVMMNMSDEPKKMKVPEIRGRSWYRSVDTALKSPHDIVPPKKHKAMTSSYYRVKAKAVVILESGKKAWLWL